MVEEVDGDATSDSKDMGAVDGGAVDKGGGVVIVKQVEGRAANEGAIEYIRRTDTSSR